MSDIVIKFENISKQYRLGLVSTQTLNHDLNRWWQVNVLKKEDPYLKIGEVNDRSVKGKGNYVWALRDIDFEVKQGDVLGIVGKNGSGKSTLLKILSRVTVPTTGSIKVKGRIASLLEVGTGFHGDMTGMNNIYMNGAILGMTKKEIDRRLDEIVDFSGVERYLDTPVKRYSSGMIVRLGFAIAAHLDPEIMVVDEVLAVGDAEFQKKAIAKMQEVSKREGRTVLFVSHNMESLGRLCKTGIYLKNGMLHKQGDVSSIIESYNSEINYFSNSFTSDEKILREVKIEQLNDYLEIYCRYCSDTIINKPLLGFVITDNSTNNRIVGTNGRFIHPTNVKPAKEGEIRCLLRQPKFLNGTYRLSVWLNEGETNVDSVTDKVKFEVKDMVAMAGIDMKNKYGPIVPEVEWIY
jgi:lipopolysaccharide transport system ATP-binding protein